MDECTHQLIVKSIYSDDALEPEQCLEIINELEKNAIF